jgi:NRAMP (natural resistance-associated macrophage protein)-like metal ion transporter
MPHSLYLGSGIVQARLQEFDVKAGLAPASTFNHSDERKYQPSLPAIKFCLKYSVAELSITLFTLALFVNSAISSLLVLPSPLSTLLQTRISLAFTTCCHRAWRLLLEQSSLLPSYYQGLVPVSSVRSLDKWFQKVH